MSFPPFSLDLWRGELRRDEQPIKSRLKSLVLPQLFLARPGAPIITVDLMCHRYPRDSGVAARRK